MTGEGRVTEASQKVWRGKAGLVRCGKDELEGLRMAVGEGCSEGGMEQFREEGKVIIGWKGRGEGGWFES